MMTSQAITGTERERFEFGRNWAQFLRLLDDIPGLGPTRRRALLKTFGSVKKLRAASVEEVASVPGIGPATAESIVAALQGEQPSPAVNMATGEIVED